MCFELHDVKEDRESEGETMGCNEGRTCRAGASRTGLFRRNTLKKTGSFLIAALGGIVLLLTTAGPATALSPPAPEKAGIVFSNGGRIVSIKADGSERKVLTRAGVRAKEYGGDISPKISPDGSRVLFLRTPGPRTMHEFADLMSVGADGTGVERILASGRAKRDDYLYDFAWSHDGTEVFLLRARDNSKGQRLTIHFDLIATRPDGSDFQRLHRRTLRINHERAEDSLYFPVQLAPSPDGRAILLTEVKAFGTGFSRLHLFDLNTRKRSLLMKDGSSGSWSPGGERIAFVSERDRRNKNCYEGSCSYDTQLFTMRADGTEVQRLGSATIPGSSFSPSWSPDGSRIAFASDRDGGRYSTELWSVAPDGNCLTRLTNGTPGSKDPSWFPGGGAADTGDCGDLAPNPLVDVRPTSKMAEVRPRLLWAGSRFRGLLLSAAEVNGKSATFDYSDCEFINRQDCPVDFGLNSSPICEGDLETTHYRGGVRKLIPFRGGLLLRAGPDGGRSSYLLTGGGSTWIYSSARSRGRAIPFSYHLAIAKAIHPVTRGSAQVRTVPGRLAPAVLPRSEVRKARKAFRIHRRTGSVKAAARRAKSPVRVARSYIQMGRELKRIGPVKTTTCKGRK